MFDALNFMKQAEIACAMTIEALFGNMKPYTPKLHEIRGFPGAIRTAKALSKLFKGGDLCCS